MGEKALSSLSPQDRSYNMSVGATHFEISDMERAIDKCQGEATVFSRELRLLASSLEEFSALYDRISTTQEKAQGEVRGRVDDP